MTGYSKSELIGKHSRILKSDKHDRDFYRNIRDTLARGEVWAGHLVNRRKDGTLYETEVTSSPVLDSACNIINYVSIHRDITREVKLERELRQAHKMEAIGTLAGGIAHDFNNILMAIIGYTEMALYKTPEGTTPVRRDLEQVLKAGYRARDLVNQILTFSHQSDQERKVIDIVPTVKEALKLLRSSLPSTIEIRQDIAIPPEKGVTLADPTQIHQVLMNLCTNAAHAMRDKGGILSVSLSSVEADAYLVSRYPDLKPGPYVRLTVGDTGHGVDPSILERIFDPYFTTKGPGEGTGMGLAVVQGIVKRHGGMITVHSELGKGTTFHALFPRIEQEIVPEATAAEALPLGSERILFIDDEKPLVDLGKGMLESLGYSVTTKTSSLEALEAFRAEPDAFDLVITDVTMPSMTGIELAKELMAIRPDIPIILCTGFSELINEKQAKEMGIQEFVMKPFVIGKHAKTIRKALEQKR
jgi:PAS domain S-box-containing protein